MFFRALLSLCATPAALWGRQPDPPGQVKDGSKPPNEAYLFAHMIQGDYGKLYYTVSLDGLHWKTLNGTKRVFEEYRGHPHTALLWTAVGDHHAAHIEWDPAMRVLIQRNAVCAGDSSARNFTNRSFPFDVPPNASGLWNSLFIKNADTVTAISGTVVDGVRGEWAIDGRLVYQPAPPEEPQ